MVSKVDIVSEEYKKKSGVLSSGMQYTIQRKSLNHPYFIRADRYFVSFGDSASVDDAFLDGYLGPFDVEDKDGNRIISTRQIKGHEGSYSKVVVDYRKRDDLVQRVREVYQKQGLKIKVRDL